MKRWAGFLVVSSFMPFAWAAEPLPPQEIHTAGLGFTVEAVQRLEKSVHKMNMDPSEPMSYCTAFPITPDGYLLTALHCLRGCLAEAGGIEEASSEYLGLKDLLVVKNPAATGAACAKFTIPALKTHGAVKVVATGPALVRDQRS